MIDPVAFTIGPFAVRWYGISYLVGLFVGILILQWLNKKKKVFKNDDQIFDFAFWLFILGVLIGGRLGYVGFYNLPYYIDNPGKIIAAWEGGMSFHGGLIGSLLVCYFYFKKHKINFIDAADLVVIPGALALTFTRLANFVNLELYGRVIENPSLQWMGVDFGDGMLRYPSQIFQSLSALILFFILLYLFLKNVKRGTLVLTYFILHGAARFLIEFIREPDSHLGFVLGNLTMGQLLALAQVILGGLLLVWLRDRRAA